MKLKELYSQIIIELTNNLENYDSLLQNDFLYKKNNDKFNYKLKNKDNNKNNRDNKKDNKRENFNKVIVKDNSSIDEKLFLLKNKISHCKNCNLSLQKKNYVLGIGNINADIMFIGEGPGADEDKTGIPFVGKSGELLTSIIEKGMKLKREEVYISNIVKCRPPGNRTPLDIEISSCINYLYEEIKIVNPKIIVTLGGTALRSLLPHYSGITRYRGHKLTILLNNGVRYNIIPTYHPSYLLRGSEMDKRKRKQELWQDIKKVMDFMGLSY